MTTILKPIDYEYLRSPFFADGGELIKKCLQQLCLAKILYVEERWMYIDNRETKKRPRLYFKRGDFFHQYNTQLESELFFLAAFKYENELSLTQIRWLIKNAFGRDVQIYANMVYRDLKKRSLCNFKYFPSSNARKECRNIKSRVSQIEKNIDSLLKDLPSLNSELNALGLNVIFLNKRTLEKLQSIDKNVENLGLLQLLEGSETFSSWDLLSTVGYIGGLDSFGSADFGGGFEGGGGESGGGGSSGDW